MFTKKVSVDPWVRIDNSILAEVWEALWKHEEIRCLDIDHFSVSVKKGVVRLSGHINRENNLQLIDKVVRSVAGVVAVKNGLVVDRDLTLRVAEALARDERTRPFILAVNCTHGWVSLGGEVPTCELQTIAEEVAAQVPSVRGVVSLPRVAGKTPDPMRRAVQPQIDAQLYGEDGQVGTVSQVVIQPRNRLVTQVIASDLKNVKYLIPVNVFKVVNKESAFLKRKVTSLSVFPVFNPSDFSPAPSIWQPPYPYTLNAVLWPAAANRNEPENDIQTFARREVSPTLTLEHTAKTDRTSRPVSIDRQPGGDG